MALKESLSTRKEILVGLGITLGSPALRHQVSAPLATRHILQVPNVGIAQDLQVKSFFQKSDRAVVP